MWRSTRKATVGAVLTCTLLGTHAETATGSTDSPAEMGAPAASSTRPWIAAWGLGMFHYKEPGEMQLTGPEAALQLRYKANAPYWPEVLQADVGVASLHYDSEKTGTMRAVPALSGRGTALWRLWASDGAAWRAGLQLDMVWTDLRGRSTTGHLGYRRLGSKAWAVLQHESADGARAEIGGLLQGRQDTFLTDAAQNFDISNRQRSGIYLAYQHRPLAEPWQGLRPWVRYSQVGRSNLDRNYYEPHNHTLQIGALIDW